MKSLIERFFLKIELSASQACWIWTACTNDKGYGQIGHLGKNVYAHRVAYEYFRGPIPSGLELDHIVCDNPPCVNPWHLKVVTHRANVLRDPLSASGINSRKEKCKHGHPLSGENLWINNRGSRVCLECKRSGESRRWYSNLEENRRKHNVRCALSFRQKQSRETADQMAFLDEI